MATRIEKQYKSNSLKLVNDILNLIKNYSESTARMSKREGELCKTIIRTIDYFLMRNNITDEDMRKAVEKGV